MILRTGDPVVWLRFERACFDWLVSWRSRLADDNHLSRDLYDELAAINERRRSWREN